MTDLRKRKSRGGPPDERCWQQTARGGNSNALILKDNPNSWKTLFRNINTLLATGDRPKLHQNQGDPLKAK
jgi:hypothetical protein